MYQAKEILLQILREASDRNVSFGKTQIVKLLYLIEVEYFRKGGERLTNLHWLFYHYGPYALELESVFEEPEFNKVEIKTQKEKDFFLYKVAEPLAPYGQHMEAKISLLIKKIVGNWKDKSLEELLDFVYFETEPMQNVKKRGDTLDFSTIASENETSHVIPLKASKHAEKEVAELRARIKPFLLKMGEVQTNEPPPTGRAGAPSDDYLEALKSWDEDESRMFAVPPNFVVHINSPSTDSAHEGN